MMQVAVSAASGITIPLHNPNENDLVCQGQLTTENLRISGGRDRTNIEPESEYRETQQNHYCEKIFAGRCFPLHHNLEQPTCLYRGRCSIPVR
jgi:hypothetical protein